MTYARAAVKSRFYATDLIKVIRDLDPEVELHYFRYYLVKLTRLK